MRYLSNLQVLQILLDHSLVPTQSLAASQGKTLVTLLTSVGWEWKVDILYMTGWV